MASGLDEIMKRRGAVQGRIIKALEHMPVEHQLLTIMSWISIEDLERAAIGICKDEE